ncbi:MAG TPA: branched-chain amino acid ABC transporter permease [Dehalococcoidia bacterium]|nr:branched-chain amino acid ABC transporter permease [Dehalococcoidia bacterium]
MEQFLTFLIPGIFVGMVYALIAMGFVTIYRTTGVLNLAQGEIFLIAGYFMLFLVGGIGLSFWLAIPVMLGMLALVGVITERIALRPLVGQPIMGIILMTLGIGAFLRGVMTLFWTDLVRPVPSVFPLEGVPVLGVMISQAYLWFGVIALVVFIGLWLFFNRTRMGLLMKAAADATLLAQSCGVSVNTVTRMSWIISCITVGLGGYMLTTITGAQPLMGALGLRSLAVVLAGGMESIGGVMLMGPVVGAAEFIFAGYFDPFVGGALKEVIAFVLLIFFLLIRPQGLFGWRIIERL